MVLAGSKVARCASAECDDGPGWIQGRGARQWGVTMVLPDRR